MLGLQALILLCQLERSVLIEIIVLTSLAINIISFGFIFYFLRYQYLILQDNANAFKILVEFINKNFEKNLEDHENIIKIVGENDEKVVQALTENDQKIVDMISETQKNFINLAMFLGYRPRNLEDL
jgi:hypothetical protein